MYTQSYNTGYSKCNIDYGSPYNSFFLNLKTQTSLTFSLDKFYNYCFLSDVEVSLNVFTIYGCNKN